MRESGNTASDLAKYRIERAEEDYRSAVLLCEIRNFSDYDDMFIASKSQTEEQVKNPRIVIDTVKGFLVKIGRAHV